MKDIFRFFDRFTFAVILLICICGIILIYSASHSGSVNYSLKQSIWLLLSIVVFWVVFKIKTDKIMRFGPFVYGAICAALFLQLVAGKIMAGTKSWVVSGGSVQISELIKIPLAIVLAKYLTKVNILGWKEFFKVAVIFGVPFVLIAMQPDLGTASILTAAVFMSILLKKIKRSVAIFSILMVLTGAFLGWTYVLKPYQKNRIISFLNPEKYSRSSGYQIIQSKIAIGSGGLKGKGYLMGSQSQYKFLPARHTDFIVSVLGEEFGFVGISVLLVLFYILFYRQFSISAQSEAEFYYVYIFNGIIVLQFLLNILMQIGLVPILGVPLPFVSYGGSSLMAFFAGVAIIFKIKYNNYQNEY